MIFGKSSLAAFVSLLTFASAASNVIQLNNKNFDDIVYESNKDTLIKFYAPWCSHCKTLAPVYEKVADTFSKNENVQIAEIDCEANRVTCSQFGIEGFPTMKLFKADKANPIDFQGSRNHDYLVDFVSKNAKAYVYIPKPVSKVVQVSDLDFDRTLLESGKNVFVVLSADYCHHCKNLHPSWEKLAEIFGDDDDVIIAELQANTVPSDIIKKRYEVQGYPTILSFEANSKDLVSFDSSRNIEGLTSWVNKIAKKHRDVDGGLLETAGRVADIDSKITEILNSSEEDVHGLATEVLSSLGAGQEYYRKLVNKIINGEDGFFAKESARLTRILSKGSLTRDKSDSLQTRLNILKAFQKDN